VAVRLTPDRGLAHLIETAARQIDRLCAAEAFARCGADAGAVVIDIRSQDARRQLGVIPGSLHIPRTVLEWRVARESPWRNPHLGGLDQQLILLCDHGYSSILAAANLVQLGFDRTGDVIGGFEAWAARGLPIVPWSPGSAEADGLPGMGPPN
jgi:rhodanese-related sulfurtransferase